MKKLTILIDMDQTLVSMLPTWLSMYSGLTGELIKEEEVYEYYMQDNCSNPSLMNYIITLPGFFHDLPPIKNSIRYFNNLLRDKHEVIIVTQLPRRSNYAAEDKRNWIKHNLPKYNLENLIFAHKKYLIKGDILFDDNPSHLSAWKENNPNGITAKINFNYNKNYKADWEFNTKDTAWKEFYENILGKVNGK